MTSVWIHFLIKTSKNEVPVPAYSEDVPENHSSLTVGDDHTYNVSQVCSSTSTHYCRLGLTV